MKKEDMYGSSTSITTQTGVRESIHIDINRDAQKQRDAVISYAAKPEPEKRLSKGMINGRTEESQDRASIMVQAFLAPSVGAASTSRTGVYKDQAGVMRADVVVRDPKTKEFVALNGVALSKLSNNSFPKVSRNTTVMLIVNDARDIIEGNTSRITGSLLDGASRTKNKAIPADVVYKNRRAQSTVGKNRTCSIGGSMSFDQLTNNFENLTNLTFLTDPDSENSPGIVIDSSRQEVTMFHKRGQRMDMSQSGVSVNADRFDTQSSANVRNAITTGGLPGKDNPMREMAPSSNILLNAPVLILPFVPDIQGIMVGVSMTYKLISIGKKCIKYINDGSGNPTKQQQRNKELADRGAVRRREQEQRLALNQGRKPRPERPLPT